MKEMALDADRAKDRVFTHYEITALVRNPEKLKSWEGRVRIVKGDALDKDAVEQAVHGPEAAIYAIGTETIGRTTLFSESEQILIDVMERNRVKRLVCITGIGAGETKGHGGFLYDRILFPALPRSACAKVRASGSLIQTLYISIIVGL